MIQDSAAFRLSLGSSPAKPEPGLQVAEVLIEAFRNCQRFYTVTA